MKVKVLVDGIYNNQQHRAHQAKVGDVIEVAGGAYGLSLVADGLVERLDKDATVPAAELPADVPATAPVAKRGSRKAKEEAA